MKNRIYAIIASAMVMLITACSSSHDGFKIDARFLNMNLADFYVYSPDGAIQGIDTIHVQGGRFTYEKPVAQAGTIVLVFPNYSVMPIFVEPGASIDIDANAAKLKDMEITGTEENKIFTEWRKKNQDLQGKEMQKQAEAFIKEHPASTAARWLIRQHFVVCEKPDIKKALALLNEMQKASENNAAITRMKTEIERTGSMQVGDALPHFSAKDINGNMVSDSELRTGKTIIFAWTSWNYDGQSMMRRLASSLNSPDETTPDHVISVCLDPGLSQCRQTIKMCNADKITTICDAMMWDSPLIKTLGITQIPFNLVLKDGKVIKKCVNTADMLD